MSRTDMVHKKAKNGDEARKVQEQLSREPRDLPMLKTKGNNIFSWTHKDVEWIGYDPHPPIIAPIAV